MAADRRQRFRELFKKLDPSGSPAAAIENGFYVPPPVPLADQIATRLELDPTSSHLLVGGIGSGKTTTLLTVKQRLQEADDIIGVFVDVPKAHSLDDVKFGVLLGIAAALARRMLLKEQPEDSLDAELKASAKRVSEITKGHYTYPDHGDDYDPDYESGEIWVPGILKPPGTPELVKELQKLSAAIIVALARKPVLLLDGLDRLDNAASFATLVREDIPAMAQAGFGVVLVGPQHIRFRPERSVQEIFTEFHLQGAAPVSTPGGEQFLRAVLRARVEDDLLPTDACDQVAISSGGLLRDLITLARAAGQAAYGSGADAIGIEHVHLAADRLGRRLLAGITAEMAKRLKEFVKVPRWGKRVPEAQELQFTLATEVDISLLMARLIIEIPGTPTRYVPHPAAVQLIAELPA